MRKATQTKRAPQHMSLRAWRDYRALSLSDLAARAQVDRQTIHRIEHGRHAPQPRTRRKLAEALHVAVEHIVWEKGGGAGGGSEG